MPDFTDLEHEREMLAHATCARGGGLAYARPFALTGDATHYAPDLTVDVRHIKLTIRIDPKAKSKKRPARSRTLSAV